MICLPKPLMVNKRPLGANEMSQLLKMLAEKLGRLYLIPRTHIVGGEDGFHMSDLSLCALTWLLFHPT